MAAWRILTWNLLGAKKPDLARAAEVIRSQRPDVVTVQEIRRGQAAELAATLGYHVRWARKHYPLTPLLWWLAEGLAVLSPWPLTDAKRMSLTPHTSTWVYRHRILLAATVTRADDTLRCYDVHLAAHDPHERIRQSSMVEALVAAEGAPLAVVAGDLNDAEAVEVVRQLSRSGLGDPGGDLTSPAIAPVRRLDYILVPHTATVTERWSPDGGPQWHALSDHLPALVEFHVPTGSPDV